MNKLQREIAKRALMIILAVTGSCPNCCHAKMSFDKEVILDAPKEFRFLSQVENTPIDEKAREDLAFILINRSRSKCELGLTCFENLIMATTKDLCFERFRYLYTAFNAFCSDYNRFLPDEKKAKPDERGIITDAAYLRVMKKYFFSDEPYITSKQLKKLSEKKPKKADLDSLFNKLSLIDETAVLERVNESLGEGTRLKDFDAFVTFEYSYFLRCKYFHGEKSIPFVSFDGDPELLNIQKCNELLQIFLTKHIGDLFAKERGEIENMQTQGENKE